MSPDGVCLRCWSSRALKHFRVEDGTQFLLCRQCRDGAPVDREVFEQVYLRYSSTKEILAKFSTEDEGEAIAKLAIEAGVDATRARAAMGLTAKPAEERRPLSWLELMRPFGYQVTTNGWARKEDEAVVVARIYELYLKGQGVLKICSELNKNKGFKTKMGRSWKPQTVANVLKNPVYCGYSRKGARGEFPPIVSVPDFNKAQEEMDRRIRRPDQRVQHQRILEQEGGLV